MALSRIVFPLLVLSVAQSITAVHVPVYMWGDLPHNSLKHSAIGAVPFKEFGMILKQELVEEPFTVIFVEETLSVEDFSLKTEGLTAYPFLLANVPDSAYLPSVESPLKALNKYAAAHKVDHVRLTENGLSADIEPEGGKFLFVNLKDARDDESRYDLLRRHNDFMEDLFSNLQQRYSKVIGIYTAHFPSWTVPEYSRVKRDLAARADPITDLSMKGLRIVFGTVYFQDGTNPEVALSGATKGESDINGTTQMSTINFGNDTSVTLNFVNEASYWILDSAIISSPSVNDRFKPEESINALLDFSYRCSNNVTFVSVRTRNDSTPVRMVTFTNVKMQAYFTTNETDLEFGDSFNCVGFFTAPIWAGIFVVTLLLAITFYGIIMMLDINTMDQFDDPKGKTVTINASD